MPEQLLKAIPDIVYKVDTEGVFTYLNEAVSILGYTPEDLIGKTFDVVVHPDDLKEVSRSKVLPKYKGKVTGPDNAPKLFDERRTGDRRTKSLEIRLVHKTTHEIRDEDILTGMLFSYGELTSTGHYIQGEDGNGKEHTGSIGVIHDITPWKHAEIELRESEKRYRLLVEDMPALVCRFKQDGTLTFVNSLYCEYFDMRSEELLGKNWFDFIPENEKKELKEYFIALTLKKPMATYEHRVISSDGSIRWQRWTDRAIFDEDGEIKEYQSIGFDITERKKSEQSLKEKEEKLHEKNLELQEKNIAIREMMDQAQMEKERIERRIAENAEKLLLPLLTRLRESDRDVTKKYIDVIERNIRELTSEFTHELSAKLKLTQREIEICSLITQGLTSKEIAGMLHISTKTVKNHRANIRKKLGISQKKINLYNYLSKLF